MYPLIAAFSPPAPARCTFQCQKHQPCIDASSCLVHTFIFILIDHYPYLVCVFDAPYPSLQGVSDLYVDGQNTATNRRNLRSVFQKQGVDINVQLIQAFHQVDILSMHTKPFNVTSQVFRSSLFIPNVVSSI